MTPTLSRPALAIRGLGCLSALGCGLDEHLQAAADATSALRPLACLLGAGHPLAALPAGWIDPRARLCHRQWSPLTMAALEAARQAVSDAAWTPAELADSTLVFATSRGNLAGWLDPWPGRRPFPMLAASNSMHAEPATAIGIACGIQGPCHVLATGCSAGLEALGLAQLLIATGTAPRALVVAAELPLAAPLLEAYRQSGILSTNGLNDPYSPATTGILPAEAAAAVALEPAGGPPAPILLGHLANSDAWRPTGIPPTGAPLARLLDQARATFGSPCAISPHASGTPAFAAAEPAAIRSAFPLPPPLVILKPLTGHCIAASGLLEVVLLAGRLRDGRLPASPGSLTAPAGLCLSTRPTAATGPVFKLAAGLGGHNSLVALAHATP